LSEQWVLIVTPTARRDVRRLDPPIKRRVEEALDRLVKDPGATPLHKLTGRPESRLRVGDWRILVELDHQARTIIVHHILPRGRAYDR
jgi:mRNA interferase RelE/StbE